MTYNLYLGDYSYSSWSLRAWLLFDRFGIPMRHTMIWFNTEESVAEQLAKNGVTTRTVPTLVTPEGAMIGESLAIAEELATRHPEAGLWPSGPLARATARALASEMHAGFSALRTDCPMTLRYAFRGFEPSDAVRRDLDRIETIWAQARRATTPDTPWLCGDYSVADAFFAPVAARIASYELAVGAEAQAYVAAHLSDPSFQRWRALGLEHGEDLPWYAQDLPTRPWPGPG